MTLRLYDFEFNLLEVENNVINAKWIVYYNGIGTFQAHLPITSKLVKIVTENRYMVAVQGKFSAIIVGKELEDELVLYGRTCNWLLTKRISPGFDAITAYPGAYAAQIALDAFSDTENFVMGDCPDSEETRLESREGYTADTVSDCLALGNLGYEVVFDIKNKKWVFNVLKGSENDLILSEGHKNAYETKCTFDIIDLATCGVFTENTDEGPVTKTVTKDPEMTGIYRWEARLGTGSETEAKAALSKLSENNEITLNVRNLTFGKDYCLGDTVRVQIIKGDYRSTEKKVIKGVEMRMEQGVYLEKPVFE